MATYYIRKTGSDAASGLTPALAWLTIGKALGASGIASGDTLYIGAGVYREVVTVAMTSAIVETKIYGDVDGLHTGDAGEVQWTAYITNDTTTPSSSNVLNLNTRDFLTFQDICFIGGSATVFTGSGVSSTNITIRRCMFIAGATRTSSCITAITAANVIQSWIIDSCTFFGSSNVTIQFTLTRPTTADFNYDIVIKNCLFVTGTSAQINITSTGANVFNGGGVTIQNCTAFGGFPFVATATNNSTIIPCNVYNCFVCSGILAFNAATSGQIIEDYNILMAGSTIRTNVTPGSHSISDGSYAPLFYTGHEYYSIGSNLKPFGMPKSSSPLLGFGNQAGSPSIDIIGAGRPSVTIASVGCYEFGQSAIKETTTVRTGSNAIKIAGYGYQDFVIPVAVSATTINIYAQYNAAYSGTLPSMNIINGTECGVANATATQVGSSGSFELLTLTFTPTSTGIITIRLISSSVTPTGNAFFDDFSIS